MMRGGLVRTMGHHGILKFHVALFYG